MRNPSSRLLKWVCALVLVLSPLAAGQNQPKFQILAQIAISNGSLTFNPALNFIYVSGGATINPPQTITVIAGAGASNQFSVIASGIRGSGAAVDIKTDNYWAADVCFPNCGAVFVYNSNNQAVTTITTGVSPYCPVDVALDNTRRRMWVGCQCGANNDPAFVFDADTFALIKGPIPTGGVFSAGPTVNPRTSRVYVESCPQQGGACMPQRIDPNTFAITPTAFGPVLAVNPFKNLLYALSGSNLQIVNGAPNPETILHTISLGYTPGSVTDNDAVGHLYLSNGAANLIELRDDQTGQPILDQNKNPITFALGSGNVPTSVVADSLRGLLGVFVNNSGNFSLWVIEDLSTVRNCGSPGASCSIGTGPK